MRAPGVPKPLQVAGELAWRGSKGWMTQQASVGAALGMFIYI